MKFLWVVLMLGISSSYAQEVDTYVSDRIEKYQLARIDASATPEVYIRIAKKSKDCNLYGIEINLRPIADNDGVVKEFFMKHYLGTYEMNCRALGNVEERVVKSNVITLKADEHNLYNDDYTEIIGKGYTLHSEILIPAGFELEVLSEKPAETN